MQRQHRSTQQARSRNVWIFGALAALGLLLSACGTTDKAGTKYQVMLESATYGENETFAPIGLLRPGEVARVTFEVTPKDGAAVDRTAQTDFRLVNKEPGDDITAFTLELSPDLTTQPYHTLTAHFVEEAQASLCGTYDGPEVLDGPVEDCAVIAIQDWTEEE